MSKINYLIVHKDHPFNREGVNSGAENATRALARALAAQGHAVVVAAQLAVHESPEQHRTAPSSPDQYGVEWWDLGAEFNTGVVLQRMHARGRYCLISAGRAQAILESRFDSRCVARILISHDRSGNDTGIRPDVLCRVVDRVVCVSNAQREVFLKAGAPPEKVVTLYNGVDHALFPAGPESQRDFNKLVFVGALVEDKGIHWLIESFCALKVKYPKITLDVFGTSGLWGRPALFDEKEIERKVPGLKFHGSVSQEIVGRAMSTAGLCVIPSIWFDPFPLTALEAQATGCPVVTFDVGGLKEGVRDQETAVVMTEISPHVLTRTLDELLANEARLREFSRNALHLCRPRFTWERVAADMRALVEQVRLEKEGATVRGPIGFVSTWGQDCGLATYASFLVSKLPADQIIVFSERVATTAPDTSHVVRCWNRDSSDFTDLERAIVDGKVALIHLNVHPEFFPGQALAEFATRIRARGIRVVAHLHNTFSFQAPLGALAQAVDRVIVHGVENRAQLIANGAPAETIEVIPHGVEVKDALSSDRRQALRAGLGVSPQGVLLSAFGFIQAHKGMEGVVEGVAHLVQRGIDAKGALIGRAMPSDPHSAAYADQLRQLAQRLQVSERITFFDSFVPEQQVTEYLQASDLVLMNYRSAHYEASGACARAVGSGALVITSLAPPFQPFGDAVWHLTSGFPLALSLELLLTNEKLRTHIVSKAKAYCEEHEWSHVAQRVLDVYAQLKVEPDSPADRTEQLSKSNVRRNPMESNSTGLYASAGPRLKILLQNRPNALTQPGGDTVVMQRTAQELRTLGHEVELDLENRQRLEDFDLVHLFNFALPDLLRSQAERCVQANVPFVVTTLCEDVPSFHNQSWEAARILMDYVRGGQDKEWLRGQWGRLTQVVPSARFGNDWVAGRAAALIANGQGEAAILRRDYPSARSIVEVPVGFDLTAQGTAEAFVREYGVSDFVLCVGRIESRKNQLMLLKALEDVDVPVVLVGGGFSYQPEYEQAVRSFRRKAKTLVLGRLSDQMLASAYAACRVHALPSWFELPGLVSLEAAAYGKNVAVTDMGTTGDYFGDFGFYASASDPQSVKNAILAGYYAPVEPALRQRTQQYTWKNAAMRTAAVYQQVVQSSGRSRQGASQAPAPFASLPSQVAPSTPVSAAPVASVPAQGVAPAVAPSVEQLLQKGEEAARAGEFEKARQLLGEAERQSPRSARCQRSLGAVALAEQRREEARRYFEKALEIDPNESKAIVGLGMCASFEGDHARGYDLFVRALGIDEMQTTALHQLIQSANVLGRFDALEMALRRYLSKAPTDREFRFCLAGCVYKQGNLAEASQLVSAVLAEDPSHRGALELKKELAARVPNVGASTNPGAVTWSPQQVISLNPTTFGSKEKLSGGVAPTTARETIAVSRLQVNTPQIAPAPTAAPTTVATAPETMPTEPSWLRKINATPVTVPVSQSPVHADRREVHLSVSGSNGSATVGSSNAPSPRVEAPSLKDGTPEQVIAHIEDLKHNAKLSEAAEACDALIGRGLMGDILEQAKLLRAEIHSIMEEFEQANRLFDSVLVGNPRSARAMCGKGALAAHSGRWDEAEAHFQKAQMLVPEHDVACAGLGLCAAQRREHQQAWHWYWRATQSNPESMRALLGLIELAYPLKRLGELEQALRQYLDLHPADLQFVYSLAGCLYAQNKMPEAKGEVEKIIIFEPAHERAVELKGIIEKRLTQVGSGGFSQSH